MMTGFSMHFHLVSTSTKVVAMLNILKRASFMEALFNKARMDDKKKMAVTTDTAGPMNSLGKLLEVHGIMHVYCTDHVLKLTANKCFPPKRLVQGQDGCQDYHDILQEVARDLSKNFFTPHKPMMLCCKHKPKLDGTAAGTTDQCTKPQCSKQQQ
jgi:hypothetical protein